MTILYSKAACELCDELKDELRRLNAEFEERDIVTRSDWFAAYRHRVPVLVGPDGTEYDPPFTTDRVAALVRLFG